MAEPTSADRTLPQPLPPLPFPDRDRLGVPLPTALTSFIGREREVQQVMALLRRPEVRLVTLTGPGGVGKTRLALRVAKELAPDFAEGAVFVPLAAVSVPQLVGPTIAHVLKVREAGECPVGERLAEALGDQHLLVVLDNFEQVVAAAPLVAELLRAGPGLTVLVTSRARLRVSGEHVYSVPPLALPDPHRVATSATASETEAVQLFVARARETLPDFTLSDENAAVVTELCRRLDGLPLAIELAAARIPVLPPRALLARLERRLPLLTGGVRDQPARLQSMRDAIAWSVDLLSPAEQVLFRRLAVFAGGCTLEAAAKIASDGVDILDGLTALVTASLLQRPLGPDDVPRYWMLETIREYGMEQLAASGEEPAVRQAHATFFVKRGERLWDASYKSAYRIEREHQLQLVHEDLDNLRAALAWLVAHEPAEALRLAGALDVFWNRSNLFAEGHQWLTRALTAAPDGEPFVRARALLASGWLAHQLGDFGQAEIDLTEALARARALGDDRLQTLALGLLGTVALSHGEPERARPLVDEERTHAAATGDPLLIAVAALNAGNVAAAMNDLPMAEALLAEALDLHQRYSGPYAAVYAQGWLGEVVLARGDTARGVSLLRDAIAGFAAMGNWAVVAEKLEALTRATAGSQPVPTARLLGAAAAMRDRIDHPRKPSERPTYDRTLAAARTKLGDAAFTEAWDAGGQLSRDEVLIELDALLAAATDARTAHPPDAVTPHDLTPREREVLRLVAAGRSNREIAEALFISPSTAITHVRHLFAKLGLDSRTAVAAWAIRHGLD